MIHPETLARLLAQAKAAHAVLIAETRAEIQAALAAQGRW